jgi:hypothetical protein
MYFESEAFLTEGKVKLRDDMYVCMCVFVQEGMQAIKMYSTAGRRYNNDEGLGLGISKAFLVFAREIFIVFLFSLIF